MARILVVDDEAPVRAVLRQMLEKKGHEVVEAPNGALGLKVLAEQPPDLLITDLIMPEKEGIETIREARKKFPCLKIIAISGGGRSDKLEKFELLSIAEAFDNLRTLVKPFERRELLEAVSTMLAE